jgi:hypothetical protein
MPGCAVTCVKPTRGRRDLRSRPRRAAASRPRTPGAAPTPTGSPFARQPHPCSLAGARRCPSPTRERGCSPCSQSCIRRGGSAPRPTRCLAPGRRRRRWAPPGRLERLPRRVDRRRGVSSRAGRAEDSNVPARRVRIPPNAARRGGAPGSRARWSRLQSTSAAAPSPGEQSMYCVRRCAASGTRGSPPPSGRRRQACGVSEPFANAFAATCASVSVGLWSCA